MKGRLSASGKLPLVPVGYPVLGVSFHDGFNFQYVALIPYAGTGIPDGDVAEISAESANFQYTPMMDPLTRRIVWRHTGRIEMINEDGSGQVTVRSGNSPNGPISSPWWHPDGSKILYPAWYADQVSQPDEIQTIRPDGTGQTTLYTAPDFTSSFLGPASYNCDGTRIGFCQLTSSTTIAMKTMNADGSNVLTIATIPTQFSGIRFDSPVWAWYTADPDRLVIANTNTVGSRITKAMDYDGTNQVTTDTGSTRNLPRQFAVETGDTYYLTSLADGSKIQKVALDGSGATDLLDVGALSANVNGNVFPTSVPCSGDRVYWDSNDDIWSCAIDGSDPRNETAATLRNYGLTG